MDGVIHLLSLDTLSSGYANAQRAYGIVLDVELFDFDTLQIAMNDWFRRGQIDQQLTLKMRIATCTASKERLREPFSSQVGQAIRVSICAHGRSSLGALVLVSPALHEQS